MSQRRSKVKPRCLGPGASFPSLSLQLCDAPQQGRHVACPSPLGQVPTLPPAQLGRVRFIHGCFTFNLTKPVHKSHYLLRDREQQYKYTCARVCTHTHTHDHWHAGGSSWQGRKRNTLVGENTQPWAYHSHHTGDEAHGGCPVVCRWGLPRALSGKEPACQCRRHKRCGVSPCLGKLSWSRKWQPTPVFLPGKSHGQRSLVGYSPWGRKESDTAKETSQAHTHSL